ncbi:MAG: hypothetical protein JWQ77_3897, partial [Jatrophihabitans sp.]|nr:hypothetical protein [Jatrophihabitans sp.]
MNPYRWFVAAASGGALQITSGTVELTDDTRTGNQSLGGAGGLGG